MLSAYSVKIGKNPHNAANNMMRDEHFPYENDTLFYSDATYQINELWNELLRQKSEDRFEKNYNETMERITKMKKLGWIDEHARGIRTLEEIANA